MNLIKYKHKKEIEMGNKGTNFSIIVLILVFVGCVVAYDARETKYEPIAENSAKMLIQSMTFQGYLPWEANENRLRAVINCQGSKIFVTNNSNYGLMVYGCDYYIAQGIEVSTNFNVFTKEAGIFFRKIPIE